MTPPTLTPRVVFELDGATFAIRAAQVTRILPRPTLLRLPNPGGGAPRRALQAGSGLVPVLGADVPDAALVLRSADGEVALGVTCVLGVGPLDAEGRWQGRRATEAEAARWTATGAHPARPPPFISLRAGRPPPAPAPTPARRLRIVAGGSAWHVAGSDLVAVHPPSTPTPVPLAGAALLGAVQIGGVPWPVVTLAPLRGTAQALVLLRRGTTAVAIVSEAAPAWVAGGAALDPDEVLRSAGLAPTPAAVAAQAGAAEPVHCLLPVTIGNRRFGIPLEHVRRVLAPGRMVRLPGRGAAPQAVHGVVGVDGRAVPLTVASAWMGLDPHGPPGVLVLLRPGSDLHAFAVEAAHPPLTLGQRRVQPMRDPARRFRALAQTPAGPLPVLDLAGLDAPP